MLGANPCVSSAGRCVRRVRALWGCDVIVARAGHDWLGTGGRLFKRECDARGRASTSVVWVKVGATRNEGLAMHTIEVRVSVSKVACALLTRAFAMIDRAHFEARDEVIPTLGQGCSSSSLLLTLCVVRPCVSAPPCRDTRQTRAASTVETRHETGEPRCGLATACRLRRL